jgi:uncharacterized protein (DUF924 family)
MEPTARALLDLWFGALDDRGSPPPGRVERWFDPPEGFDAELRARFGAQVEEALAAGLGTWTAEPRGRLALVLLLDQLPRNIHRGRAASFAGDARALGLVQEAIASGEDRALWPIERCCLYLPLMHAEDPQVQDRSVEAFTRLAREPVPSDVAAYLERSRAFAVTHRDAIRRFGRFPARNAALGRTSTAEERSFLARHPAGFVSGDG